MKQKRTNYADERRGPQKNCLATGNQVLVTQRKENKSTTLEDTPYKVTKKYGNEGIVTSPEGVTLGPLENDEHQSTKRTMNSINNNERNTWRFYFNLN